MRESRTSGFVRGAHSDMRPYLDLYLRPFISCPFISWTECEKEGGVLTTREYIVLGTEGKMRIRTD